ncbi:MAG: DNA-3-methyladenine glycosylase [Armatimonadota bacterium]
MDGQPFPPEFFLQPTITVARQLLGALVIRDVPQRQLIGRIVETEAYLHNDPACHAVRELPGGGTIHQQTKRNASMFGPPGHAYVYFTYGNHYMFNVITQPAGVPEAVLIRALEPLAGIDVMTELRGVGDLRQLTNGPGKLAKALAIDKTLDGHDLSQPPLRVVRGESIPDEDVVTTTRIGISKGTECPWRFYVKGNPWVSRK